MLRLLLNTRFPSRLGRLVGLLVLSLLVAGLEAGPSARASDHADPTDPLRLSSNDDRGLTGLFIFPTKGEMRVSDPKEGDSLMLILCVNRSLVKSPPYPGLDTYQFSICIDTQRTVRINHPKDPLRPQNAEERDTARYGGIVNNPEQIEPTFTITMRLRNDLQPEFTPENFLERSVTVDQGDGKRELEPAELRKMKWGAGVRDDPFIFPPFFGTNVIAMAVRVPYGGSLPAPHGSYIVWATARRHDSQFDHVGRSQRTQLPRFDFLNTLPPKEHVSAIRKMRTDPTLKQDVLRYLFPTEFAFRPFDDQPDVMIFTREHPVGYPNGRRLEDDVAKLACEQGDCQLFELSFMRPRLPESERYSRYEGGRPTANDKPLLETWPYLAEPWPDSDLPPPPGLSMKNQIYVCGILLFSAGFLLLPWVLFFRGRKQLRRLRDSYLARIPPPSSMAAAPPQPVPGGPPT